MEHDLCFLLHVYRDELLARRLIGELRTYYPIANILCISDGEPAPGFKEFCITQNLIFLAGARLKTMDCGAFWVERMFRAFLEHSQASILIKLDPDSRMHRAFRSIPPADWFGTIRRGFFRPLIGGGCVGFSRSLVERIVNSGLLGNPIYTQLPFGYQRYGVFARPGETPSTEWVSFTDGIMADVMVRLGVAPTPWYEVCIHGRDPLPDDLTPYAVTHPHATL